MSVTLIREYAKPDVERLEAVYEGLANLPANLWANWKRMCGDVATSKRFDELHAGRDEYRGIYEGYLELIERYRSLAEKVGSPLQDEFEAVAAEVRKLHGKLFDSWHTLDDLYELIIESFSITEERARYLAERYPPPQSWYDETDDPFAPPE